MDESANEHLKIKVQEKAICNKCGRQYISRKSLKNHELKVHVTDKNLDTNNQPKKVQMSIESLLIEDAVSKDSSKQNNKTKEDVNLDEAVKEILVDSVIDASGVKKDVPVPQSNVQCGVCTKVFEGMENVRAHMDTDHRLPNCGSCEETRNKRTTLESTINSKDKVIEALTEKNELVVRKNVALDKEVRRLQLALTESEKAKNIVKKELESKHSLLASTLKKML